MNDLLINQLIIQSMNNRISTYSHEESLWRMYFLVYLVSLLRTVTDCIGRMGLPAQKMISSLPSGIMSKIMNKIKREKIVKLSVERGQDANSVEYLRLSTQTNYFHSQEFQHLQDSLGCFWRTLRTTRKSTGKEKSSHTSYFTCNNW